MHKLIKTLVQILVHCWCKVYTYQSSLRLVGYRNWIYTIWIRNFIGNVGEHVTIKYPCSLQGGGHRNILIGNRTTVESHSILGCWEHYGDQHFTPEIIIGDNCWIGEYTQITSCNKITIGNGLLTGRYVYIGDNAHGGLSWEESMIPPIRRQLVSKGEIKIGENVWICDKVTILGGVTIGDNVIIGAGSIVTHDIPSNSIAAGIPAKIIKQLKNE